jgi:hypothetical protein
VRSTRHRILAGLAGLALLGSATACSGPTTHSTDGPAGGQATTAKVKKKPAVDSCTLLEKDEIKAIIGANDGGHHGGGVGESVCEWDNEDNYHSVTVSIGNRNTAAGGQLPVDEVAGPGDPGPDGIRFASDNTATFVVAERVCYVQVVTDPTSDKDRTTAVRLIRLIRARTKGKL